MTMFFLWRHWLLSLQPSLLQVEHAKEVGQMDEELDVADLAVLSAFNQFEIFVAHDWPNDSVLPFNRLRNYIVELNPACEAAFGPDNRDALTWIVILCNAFYDPYGATNHFVPAFTAEELGDEQFDQLREIGLAETDARLDELKAGCEMDVETDEDLALRNDYQITWQHVKAWRAFQERCYKSKLHPVEVLGDGNCMLWSLKCLKDDDISGKNTMTPKKEDYKILKTWRQQLHDQWIALSTNEDWQTLFNQIYVQSDEPLRFETAETTQNKKDETKIKKERCRSPSSKKRRKAPEAAAPESAEPPQPPAESEGDPQKKDQAPAESEADPQKKHKRVAACRPAPCFQSGPKEPLKMQQPKRKAKVAKEDAKDDAKQGTKKVAKGKGGPNNDAKGDAKGTKRSKKNEDAEESALEAGEDVEVPEISETETVIAEPVRTRVRKKAKTSREVRLRSLRAYLGEKGVTYPAWMGAHWRHNGFTVLHNVLYIVYNYTSRISRLQTFHYIEK